MIMKRITTAGALVAGALLASQAAHANTFVGNDVYMGFQNSSASDDYILNLGTLSSIVGQSSVVNLSSDFSSSDFGSVYNGGSGTTLAAVVGAANNVNDSFGTETRTSNFGDPGVAGSTGPTTLEHYSQDSTVYADLSSIAAPATTGGSLDSTKSWSAKVGPTEATGNFYSATGFNPNSAITTSSVLYEDLYLSTDTQSNPRSDAGAPYVYEGYFTIDFTGSTPDVTFTGADVAVPEPATYGILAGVGVLVLALRRQLTGVIA